VPADKLWDEHAKHRLRVRSGLFLAGGSMWGLLPLPAMVGAFVRGLPGGVMIASARPKAHHA
jgi:hypothetical protein